MIATCRLPYPGSCIHVDCFESRPVAMKTLFFARLKVGTDRTKLSLSLATETVWHDRMAAIPYFAPWLTVCE